MEPGLVRALRDTRSPASRVTPPCARAVVTGAGRATTGGMQLQFLMDLNPAAAKAFITLLHEAISPCTRRPFPPCAW